jgi:putative DNA primase/helicase
MEFPPPTELAAKVVDIARFRPDTAAPEGAPKTHTRLIVDPDGIVTEDSAAQKFVEKYRDRLRFCHSSGAWFVWDDVAWRPNKTGLAFQWAREMARGLSQSQPDRVRYVTSKTTFAGGVERFARHLLSPVTATPHGSWVGQGWQVRQGRRRKRPASGERAR